jgi:RNA polymerase sigma factor (sigma-70 family)
MAVSTLAYRDVTSAVGETMATADRLSLQRLAQGDTVAFWGLWERYRAELFAHHGLRWMSGNLADAEDALSSSSLKACQYLADTAPEIRSVKGVLTRLLHNHCMEMWREHKRHSNHLREVKASGSSAEETSTTVQESVEETLMRHETGVIIRHAMENLPTRLREVAVLRLLHELSYEDIAARLHILPANARKRFQQARTRLQEQLSPYCAGEDRLPALRLFSTTGVPPAGQLEPISTVDEADGDIPAQTMAPWSICVALPHGVERCLYLNLDHKPTRQQQKLGTLYTYVQRHPRGWKKRRVLADLLYTMGQWEQAIVMYRQVLQQRPDCLMIWLRLGEILGGLGRNPEAITAYTQALSCTRTAAAQYHVQGLLALCRQQFHSAAAAFTAAAHDAPQQVVHWQSLGLTHLRAAQPVEALQAFTQALQYNPDDICALTYSPAALYAVGRVTEARQCATRALELESHNVLALTFLIRLLSHTEPEHEETSKQIRMMLRRAFHIAPTSPDVYEALAHYHMARGAWSQALAVLRRFTSNHPTSPRGWYYAARWAYRCGATETATAAIRRAYALDPCDAHILQAACTILLAAGRYNEVSPVLDSMLQQFPGDWSVWTTAGRICLQSSGETERACNLAAHGPRLQPSLAQAWFHYGRVLILASRYQEAITALQQGWRCLPAGDGHMQSIPAALWLGDSYWAVGKAAEAHRWWTKVTHLSCELRPTYPAMAHYWQGKAWMALGQQKQAHQAFHAALHWHLFYPARQEVQAHLKGWS